jgi:hypothetical protein
MRTSWERRVGQRPNLGRRRTDTIEHRRAAVTLARLGVAVKIGVAIALFAAVGATLIAWRARLVSTPIALLIVLVVAGPWAIAHRLVSRSRSADPFAHVDRRIWLP